uniref:BTB domain-containing protein n=1 Tax=Loa loa TaxID=7209 RepID=A0A1I7V6W1_LOALO
MSSEIKNLPAPKTIQQTLVIPKLIPLSDPSNATKSWYFPELFSGIFKRLLVLKVMVGWFEGISMVDVPALLEHGNNEHDNSDQDHTYYSIINDYNITLAERLTMFRNESIGCDVEFIVGIEEKTIKAHKLVLGCGSQVFATMFYGKMTQETPGDGDNPMTVVVPDVTPHAFTTLVNFLYLDLHKIESDDNDVMETLYAAKKYDVKTLISACVEHLISCLTPSNALCLFSQACFFDEPSLIEQCLLVIDTKTDEVLKSPGLRDIDRDTLVAVLKRNELNATSELVVFKAAQSWSEAECERREIEVNPSNQRLVLGPVLSLIRFPLMTISEFGEAASSSLLTCEEIAQVFLHLTVVPRPPISYPTDFRCNGCSRHVVKPFPVVFDKQCSTQNNKVCFEVDREILVIGFGIMIKSSEAQDLQATVEIQLNLKSNYGKIVKLRKKLLSFK